VTAPHDLLREVRIAADGDPEHEEGRLHAELVQEIEDGLRLPLERSA